MLFGRDGRVVAVAQREFPQIFPKPGDVEHDPEAIWTLAARDRARGAAQAGIAAAGRRRHRRHQPARDDGALGQADRQAGGARDRLAEPRQRADLRSPQGRRPRSADPPQDRPGRRRLLLGHQGHAPARDRARPARPRRARRHPVRHHRHVPDLAPDRRQAARHRRDQRQPHADVRHPRARLGRRAAADPRRAAADAAGGAGLVRGLRRDRRGAARRRDPDRRHRRRPAGRAVRPGVLHAGHGQEHLRHRLLPADEHRDDADAVGGRPADDDRLEGRRRGHLRARRRRVHRRRRGAVDARRAARHRQLGRHRAAGDVGARRRRRLPGAGVRRPRRAALGSVRARHSSSA